MTCHSCKIETVKAGRGRDNAQRWKCHQCGKRFSEPRQTPFGADVRLPQERWCVDSFTALSKATAFEERRGYAMLRSEPF